MRFYRIWKHRKSKYINISNTIKEYRNALYFSVRFDSDSDSDVPSEQDPAVLMFLPVCAATAPAAGVTRTLSGFIPILRHFLYRQLMQVLKGSFRGQRPPPPPLHFFSLLRVVVKVVLRKKARQEQQETPERECKSLEKSSDKLRFVRSTNKLV